MASLGVSPPDPWLRVPRGLGAGSDALQAPARWGRGGRGECYVQGEVHGMWGTEAPATPPPHPWGLEGGGHQGAWLPGESGSTKGTCASGSVGVGVSVWSGPAPMASEVPGCR